MKTKGFTLIELMIVIAIIGIIASIAVPAITGNGSNSASPTPPPGSTVVVPDQPKQSHQNDPYGWGN